MMRALGTVDLLDRTFSMTAVGSSLSNSPEAGVDTPSLSPLAPAPGVPLARDAEAVIAEPPCFWVTLEID
jgi:hypothetical protein